jgi:hypothetical protein
LRPDDSLTIPKMALSIGFTSVITLNPAIRDRVKSGYRE